MKYLISTDPKEIEYVIRKCEAKNESIMWQSTLEGRRVHQIGEVGVDNIRKIVRFKIDETHALKDLDKDLFIYVKLSFRNTIFKGELLKMTEKDVYVSIPDEIQLEELREFPRFSFKPDEERFITLGVRSSLVTMSTYSMKVKLLNVSQTGLAFLISHGNRDIVMNNQLQLTTLGEIELENKLLTRIVYENDFMFNQNGKKMRSHKMGAQFEAALELHVLNTYIRSQEGFNYSSIGFIGNDADFQNSLHYKMNVMLKQLIKQNNIFQTIDKAQEVSLQLKENDYFPKHINLVAKISCGLAKIMGIETKKVLQKLIYASFVHDIAFYTRPKLALIKNMKHFELVKADLSLEEQDIFKNAPKYAFDYAFYDKFSPKGVEAILIQSRELPDGSGYPNKLHSDQINPLAAIFMVAHDLTDYILERKNWNYQEYFIHYKKHFKGGVFDEIFEFLEITKSAL